MGNQWLTELRHDPISGLLSTKQDIIDYFVDRDLLNKKVAGIEWVWTQKEVQRILRKQQADGSWKASSSRKETYPPNRLALVETWKNFRLLVKHYELTRKHEVARRAVEFLFTWQTTQGDIRGMIGDQYATYYTGAMLGLIIQAGYAMDPRVEKGLQWLLSMRQNDGGWTIPILTHKFDRETGYRITATKVDPIEPDKSKPFSHNWTDMVLRGFAAHPQYRKRKAVKEAANLLKTRFFQPDVYTSYQAASYWVRFGSWWTNLITSLESLALLGYPKTDPDIQKALKWFNDNQQPDGLWNTTYVPGKEDKINDKVQTARRWISLRICRLLNRFET